MMNLLKLFSCRMVLLVSLYRGCQSQQIRIDIHDLEIWHDNDPRSVIYTEQVLVKVSGDQDEYFFEDPEVAGICGQRFTSQNIEIKSVYSRTLTFSLITADKNLTFDCLFLANREVQVLFNQLRKTLVLQASNSVSFNRTVLRRIDGRIAQFTNNGLFYRKQINRPREVHANFSYNMVRQYTRLDPQTGATIQIQEADLVFLSRRFNITGLVGNNKVGLCPSFYPDGLFLLRFADSQDALLFISLVEMDKDVRIPCSVSNNWLSLHTHLIDQPGEFELPRLPYIR